MDNACHKYLQMLLMTGYHKRTIPDIFTHDVQRLSQICNKTNAEHTLDYINKNHFSTNRYFDLIQLRNRMKNDISLNLNFVSC
jgi:hypothetical protein